MERAGPARIGLSDGEIDLGHRVVRRTDRVAHLTEQEAEILRYLALHAREDVSRDALLVEVLGYAATSTTRAADLAIRRVRTKIEVDPSNPKHLLTVYGVGYRLMPETGQPRALRTNVPPARDGWVGRLEMVADLLDQLREAPLTPIVLTGPAGVGKSRVAASVAREAAGSVCPSGAFRVDLSIHGDPTRALATVAGLGLKEAESTEVARALAERGPTLVVLDDAESSPDQARQLVLALAAAGVATIVTSRAPLGLDGARVLPVPPLSLDDAASLFAIRAGEARAGWEPSQADAQAIDDIVQGTDSLPLALELAATRMRSMSTGAIAAALDRSLRLLRSRGEGRHASMQAAIDWSWTSLDDEGRLALVRLTPFRGGAPLDAAIAVIDLPEATEVLHDLVERALLRQVDGRVTPFHVVTEYAAAHGDPEEVAAARARHTTWYSALAREHVEPIRGPAYAQSIVALTREVDNLQAALDASVPPGGESAAWLLEALAVCDLLPWRARRPYTIAVLDSLPAQTVTRGRVLNSLLWGEAMAGHWERAHELARELLENSRAAPDLRSQVDAHRALAAIRATLGKIGGALDAAEQAVALAADDPGCRARALSSLGGVLMMAGRLEEARDALETSVGMAEARGDLGMAGAPIMNLGSVLAMLGDHPAAFDAWRRAEPLLASTRGAGAHSGVLFNRGWAHMLAGDWEAAAADLEHAADVNLDAGFRGRHGWSLIAAAVNVARMGLPDEALTVARHGLDHLAAIDYPDTAVASSILGALLALTGQPIAAAAELARSRSDLPAGLGLDDDTTDSLVAAWTEGADAADLVTTLAAQGRHGREGCTLHAVLLRGSLASR